MIKKFRESNFYTKLFFWEFWPYQLVYFPVIVYYLFKAAKAKSITFFSAANPGIESGGLTGESKIDLLDQIPEKYKPTTVFIDKTYTIDSALKQAFKSGLKFPFIAKPNVGERGFLVKKIHSKEDLNEFFDGERVDLLFQEYVDYPIELAILYYRLPESSNGEITSVTRKEFLGVTGDGKSTVRELLQKSRRARLQLKILEDELGNAMDQVLPKGKHEILVHIGNHIRGTKFLNGNGIIDKKLENVFDEITSHIQGVFFCRYDLKVPSIEDLKLGKNIKVMEVNGVSAEPAHIYDPEYSVTDAYKDLFKQIDIICQIAMHNISKGFEPMTVGEFVRLLRGVKDYKKKAMV
ncbi:MAG: hypothetical protein ACEPOW_07075 [Bacteroidales bacterium]